MNYVVFTSCNLAPSYQHWSVSHLRLVYPENPEEAAAAELPDVVFEVADITTNAEPLIHRRLMNSDLL